MWFFKKVLVIIGIVFVFGGSIFAYGKIGVLVMAHGGNAQWDQNVREAVQPVEKMYPTEIAFGMADPNMLQKAISHLENQGVDTIIAVPLFVSSHSAIIRQTEYLFRMREKLADPPLPLHRQMHGHSQKEQSHGGANHYYEHTRQMRHNHSHHLTPIQFKAKIILTPAIDNHPLVGEILWENIQQYSTSPEKEILILVAHGPNKDEDNVHWLKNLADLGEQIQQYQIMRQKKRFQGVYVATVRDDAEKEIYEKAKQELRRMVEDASAKGTAIVVPVLLSFGGIEEGIKKRLEGLHYVWVQRALLPHPKITHFLMERIKEAQH